jgi:alginate O-acetyltransferase complex protein AlgI
MIAFILWPGMDPRQIARSNENAEEAGNYFVRAYLWVLTGLFMGLLLSIYQAHIPSQVLGPLGVVPFLFIFHFGFARIITSLFWIVGFSVPKLFDQPLSSSSLGDFWSRRWNLPFVQMNKVLFVPLIPSRAGRTISVLLIFALSGILHELALSFPVNAGWGLPSIYFVLQGTLVILERRLKLSGVLNMIFAWLALIIPFPLLFHSHFCAEFILPLYARLHEILMSYEIADIFSLALWVAAAAHGIVLCAGIQLPWRLKWREDLQSLMPFNRKILWNYGVFIFLLVVAFGVETAIFHTEMIAGERAALGLAGLIGGFWLLRILADSFYFSHEDWPPGPQFVIGHALLNTAFVGMCGTYLGLLVWHLF